MINFESQKDFRRSNSDVFIMANERVINVPISLGCYNDFVDNIIALATDFESSYVCVMNVHMLIEAYYQKSFKAVLENANLIIPDGKPLTWALHLLKRLNQDRIAGMDLLPSLLTRSEEKKLSVYFYGGTQQLLDKTHKYLKKRFPALNVAGSFSPPFRKLTEEEESEVISRINLSNANIVFVVLGCPKQEKWMAAMKGKINAVMIGIGGALPVMVGLQKRAPKWMQKFGMEWLYRLHLEPKRLFMRYAITNSVFIYLIGKELIKKNFYRNSLLLLLLGLLDATFIGE